MSTTPKLGLEKPAHGSANWDVPLNSNADKLDDAVGTEHTVAGAHKFASQALGDLLYFDGSNWVRFPPGVDGRVLTTHGAGASPTWESSGGVVVGIGVGDMLYWDGAAWALISAGAEGKVLTAHGAATETWETPASADPIEYTKRVMQAGANYGNTSVLYAVMASLAPGGTITSADDSDGCWHNYATTAVSGNQAYNCANSYQRPDFDPVLIGRVKTAASIADVRLWVGYTSNYLAIGGADAPTTCRIAAFRFSTSAGDANWKCVTANTATPLVTDSGVAVAANAPYLMRIELDSATSTVRFYINSVLVGTHVGGTFPIATMAVYFTFSVTTLTASAKNFKWSRWAVLHK